MDNPSTILRMRSPQSPTTRQTTRALQELGGRGQRLSEIFSLRDMATTLNDNNTTQDRALRNNETLRFGNGNNTPLQNRRDNNSLMEANGDRRMSLNSSMVSNNTPSPDEMVIQARGRRQVPLTFSPDMTPLRQQMQRNKLASTAQNSHRLSLPANLRVSPRKRLILNDSPTPSQESNSIHFSPMSQALQMMSPLAKKVRLDDDPGPDPVVSARGLTHAQLVDLVAKIVKMHPDIRDDVSALLPSPDLSAYEESLNYLKRNIYKSLPNTRLESKTDSMAFSRASQHLSALKKEIGESVKKFLESEQWTSLVDYSLLAWEYVQATPVWDNAPHNNTRKSCFKTLAAGCHTALKRGQFNAVKLNEVRAKLEAIYRTHRTVNEVDLCLKQIEKLTGTGEQLTDVCDRSTLE